jgi:uncharacterized membrane protein
MHNELCAPPKQRDGVLEKPFLCPLFVCGASLHCVLLLLLILLLVDTLVDKSAAQTADRLPLLLLLLCDYTTLQLLLLLRLQFESLRSTGFAYTVKIDHTKHTLREKLCKTNFRTTLTLTLTLQLLQLSGTHTNRYKHYTHRAAAAATAHHYHALL